ncbi:MAG: DNA-binding response regulator [Candidatus Angelobacter sp.]|nr:DNA-binding response regulator [Candidatus Angelobacter sp.]
MSLGTAVIRAQAFKPVAAPPSRKKTLVVDDSETILHAICTLLEHHDIVEVAGRAESGTQTLDVVLDLKPDLVLMDADMPGMSGLRTALLLSQLSPTTEIILMSMDTSPQFRAACARCGAKAVIYKPRFLRELSKLLNRSLRPANSQLTGSGNPTFAGRRTDI